MTRAPITSPLSPALMSPDPVRRYPRLRVQVWRRGGDRYQVGLDLEGGVVIRAPADVAAALGRLDGSCTIAEAAVETGAATDEVAEVLAQLPGHLLEPPPRASMIRLIGAGRIGCAIAELLPAQHALVLVDPDPPPAQLYQHRLPTAADCLRTRLQALGRRVSVAPHWWGQPSTAAITVIAQDRSECDRALTSTLVRDDQPHLVVRLWQSGVVAGPLVQPGRTGCVRCGDLLRGADPAWPTVLAQAARGQVSAPQHLVQWAAALVVAELERWLATGSSALCNATQELSAGHGAATRQWPLHPECGCVGL